MRGFTQRCLATGCVPLLNRFSRHARAWNQGDVLFFGFPEIRKDPLAKIGESLEPWASLGFTRSGSQGTANETSQPSGPNPHDLRNVKLAESMLGCPQICQKFITSHGLNGTPQKKENGEKKLSGWLGTTKYWLPICGEQVAVW